ncbi:type VI secretion system amidase effector protein Tae4 [Aquabacterium sp.]|uniref:type VI secretion system amidase effector protein Tae4 n=1 Tax=Aquabacterium sp. TaxID=1872578 RepID=UPI003D6CED3B
MNKVLKQSEKIKTNTQAGSICTVKIMPVKFADLWAGYPKTGTPYVDAKGEVPTGFENQCAIRVSVSLTSVGLAMKSFKGATVLVNANKAAIRAQELADWLKLQPFCGLPAKPEGITGKDWQDKIKGRTGIVYFKDYWARAAETNPTGDHIDLWNGSKLTATGLLSSAQSFMRFTLGLDRVGVGSVWNLYSDLGKSKEILFWEVK